MLCGAGENSIIIVGGANQAWPEQLPPDTQQVSTPAGTPATAATWRAAVQTGFCWMLTLHTHIMHRTC